MTSVEQQGIPFLEVSRQCLHIVVRLVSSPITVNAGTRIVAVLDREDGKMKILAGTHDMFANFARWGMNHNCNPCGNDEGVDWSLTWNWIGSKVECDPCGDPFSLKLSDDEIRWLDSEEPIYPRIIAAASRRYGPAFVDAAQKSLQVSNIRNSQEDYEPAGICSECKGKCCLIYLTPKKGGVGRLDMEDETGKYRPEIVDMVRRYVHAGQDYGVEPRYNPAELYAKDASDIARELGEKGITRGACEYQGRDGCLIPREKRPKLCNMFRCGLWRYNWL
jgi:hypothetical protein